MWNCPLLLLRASTQNLFSVYFPCPFNFGIWRKARSLNQPKCDNVYPFHGKPVLNNTCYFWQTLNRKTNETKSDPETREIANSNLSSVAWPLCWVTFWLVFLICALRLSVFDCLLICVWFVYYRQEWNLFALLLHGLGFSERRRQVLSPPRWCAGQWDMMLFLPVCSLRELSESSSLH